MNYNSKSEKLFSRDFILLLLTCFSAAITHNVFLAVFPIYVLDSGGDNSMIGSMASVLVIASMVTRLVCGYFQDKFGRKTILVAGAIAFTLNTAAYIFLKDITSLYVLRIINGVSQGMYFGAAGTIVADIVPDSKLVDGLGYFSVAGSVAAAFAPIVGVSLYNYFGEYFLFIAVTLTALVGIITSLMIRTDYKPQKIHEHSQPKNKFNLLNSHRHFLEFAVIVPCLISFFIFFGNSSVTNFLTAYGQSIGMTGISLFFTFNSLTIIAVRLVNGKLVGKFGAPVMISFGIICMAASYIFISAAQGMSFIIIAGFLCGIGFGISAPLINAAVFRMVSPERKGIANATYAIFGDLGNGAGAFAWGFVSQTVSYCAIFIGSAISAAIAAILHLIKLVPKYKSNEI